MIFNIFNTKAFECTESTNKLSSHALEVFDLGHGSLYFLQSITVILWVVAILSNNFDKIVLDVFQGSALLELFHISLLFYERVTLLQVVAYFGHIWLLVIYFRNSICQLLYCPQIQLLRVFYHVVCLKFCLEGLSACAMILQTVQIVYHERTSKIEDFSVNIQGL